MADRNVARGLAVLYADLTRERYAPVLPADPPQAVRPWTAEEQAAHRRALADWWGGSGAAPGGQEAA